MTRCTRGGCRSPSRQVDNALAFETLDTGFELRFSCRSRLNSLKDVWKANILDQATEAQSGVLSNSASVFELQIHDVKTNQFTEYLKDLFVHLYHLWRFAGGYSGLSTHYNLMNNNKVYEHNVL
ncbi:unnamed protein product [Trichobilharzia regenti]|nr:unnamed protein product [Trichobilharzia regenti]